MAGLAILKHTYDHRRLARHGSRIRLDQIIDMFLPIG
jgi:hypothetical protein